MITKCVVDANIIIAASYPHHTLHNQAKLLFAQIHPTKKYLNPLIISEIATILLCTTKNTQFTSQIVNNLINNQLSDIQTQPLTSRLIHHTLSLFSKQPTHKLSFADCSLIAQAKILKTDTILTFDQDLHQIFQDQYTFLPTTLE